MSNFAARQQPTTCLTSGSIGSRRSATAGAGDCPSPGRAGRCSACSYFSLPPEGIWCCRGSAGLAFWSTASCCAWRSVRSAGSRVSDHAGVGVVAASEAFDGAPEIFFEMPRSRVRRIECCSRQACSVRNSGVTKTGPSHRFCLDAARRSRLLVPHGSQHAIEANQHAAGRSDGGQRLVHKNKRWPRVCPNHRKTMRCR
jgi:hypothetical protein